MTTETKFQEKQKEDKKKEMMATIASLVVMAGLAVASDIAKDKAGVWVKQKIAPKADAK
jgi:hypothetical protein